jgi:bifunctional enzyme CysN/CysC
LNRPCDVKAWLADQERTELLRFITCGSVDDGKSTLIGRLLYETRQIFDDQLAGLKADSRKHGTQGKAVDFALLVDGLSAEREQGITIDVAYRYFASDKRKFIVADTPGHEQYTRNMVTGASTADLAVLLVDARKGVLTQTRRHSYLAKLVGIRRFVLAVNKMDLVDYDRGRFEEICAGYGLFAEQIGIEDWVAIPVSGLNGDNVVSSSQATPWHDGPSLLEHLDSVPLDVASDADKPLRMPVQWVNRPNQDFRGFAGQIASGAVAPGDEVRVLPSGRVTRIERIVTAGGDLDRACAGRSVTLTFADEVDCSRGDVIAAAGGPPEAADQFEATIVWMADEPLLPGRGYWLKLGTQTVTATVHEPKYEINVNTLEHLAAKTLDLNSIGIAEIATDREIVFEPYTVEGSSPNRILGGFILIDKLSNATLACGMLHFALRRALNIHRQHLDVSRETHAALKRQKAAVLWFTGLSGAGKSTIAHLVGPELERRGLVVEYLDGDTVRTHLSKGLGFSKEDRDTNIERIGWVASRLTRQGGAVIAAAISPYEEMRRRARAMVEEWGSFVEVHVAASVEECARRDVKGLYERAFRGEIKGFTGVDDPYEAPANPELLLDTEAHDPEESAQLVVAKLEQLGLVRSPVNA